MRELTGQARRQNAAFTRAQAIEAGVPIDRLRERWLDGELTERHRGVFLGSTQPSDFAAEFRAALLAAGPGAVLAGRSAAWVWHLPCVEVPVTPELLVPRGQHAKRLRGLQARRAPGGSIRHVLRQGWPVTLLDDTVRDLAGVIATGDLRRLVQELVLERRTTLERLASVLGRGRQGSSRLRAVLRELDPRFQSERERILHRALRQAGLRPVPQYVLLTPGGRRRYLDLAIEDVKLGIEVDGFLPHMRGFADDRRRNNEICLELGWVVAHFAVEDLAQRLEAVVSKIVRWVTTRRSK